MLDTPDTLDGMAIMVGDREMRPLTADEVMRMVETGVLSEDEPVELLHGMLVRKAVKNPSHEIVKVRLNLWLAPGFVARRYDVRIEGAFIVPDRTSLPEPDLAVVPPDDRVRHPADALLMIEVAASSLRTDTRVKAPLYAAAGIPEYWVVDIDARRLLVFTKPGAAGYESESVLTAGTRARPRSLDVEPLDLTALFAGLG